MVLWKTVWQLNIYFPEEQAIPPLDIYPIQMHVYTKTCTALFITAPNWRQTKCPSTDEWLHTCGKAIRWNTTQQRKGADCGCIKQHECISESLCLVESPDKKETILYAFVYIKS